jgi:hypothetical protein
VAVLHKVPSRPGYTTLFGSFSAVVPKPPPALGGDAAEKKSAPRNASPFGKPTLAMVVSFALLKLLPDHVRTAIMHVRQVQIGLRAEQA